MSLQTAVIRREFKKSDDIRDAGLTTPEDVRRFDDIVYGPDSTWNVLDVYRPGAAGDRPLPVIVSVHGGGWVYGDKERYQYYCMDLARRGFAVVNFTYRLAPEHRWPGCLEDTCLVFSWLPANADKYGLDTKNVFAVGDSAGGHILSVFSELCVNPDYAALYPFAPPEGFRPKAVALNCGSYHHEYSASGPQDIMTDVLPDVSEESYRLIDALRYVTPAFPPAFLMTAVDDFLKKDALLMAEKLAENDVPFELHLYGGLDNRLGHVFHCNIRSEDARRCNDDECGFFRRFIGE